MCQEKCFMSIERTWKQKPTIKTGTGMHLSNKSITSRFEVLPFYSYLLVLIKRFIAFLLQVESSFV